MRLQMIRLQFLAGVHQWQRWTGLPLGPNWKLSVCLFRLDVDVAHCAPPVSHPCLCIPAHVDICVHRMTDSFIHEKL